MPGDNTLSDNQNWNNPDNWNPAIVPTACYNVYIPGNSNYYPNLSSPAECNNIYFIHGSELGRPDLLTYNKAHIQMNFDLKQTSQHRDSDEDLVLKSDNTFNRMKYFADVSSDPIERERWYMFSSPCICFLHVRSRKQ